MILLLKEKISGGQPWLSQRAWVFKTIISFMVWDYNINTCRHFKNPRTPIEGQWVIALLKPLWISKEPNMYSKPYRSYHPLFPLPSNPPFYVFSLSLCMCISPGHFSRYLSCILFCIHFPFLTSFFLSPLPFVPALFSCPHSSWIAHYYTILKWASGFTNRNGS